MLLEENIVEIREKLFGDDYLVSVLPLNEQEGKVTGCLFVGSEVARHDRIEKTQDRELMKLLLEKAEHIIFIQDIEGNYLFFSSIPACSLEQRDMIGKDPFVFFEPAIANKIVERVKHVAQSGQQLTHLNNIAWQGNVVSFIEEITPVRDATGKITSAATTWRKITDRPWMEKKPGSLADSTQNLTKRESEILRLIASGFTNKQIADKLFVSQKTVETHRARIMQKLDIHKTADLIRYAIKSGLSF